MKRIVTYIINENNKNIIQSISNPMNETDLNLELNDIKQDDKYKVGFIDEKYIEPVYINGMNSILYFNSDLNTV